MASPRSPGQPKLGLPSFFNGFEQKKVLQAQEAPGEPKLGMCSLFNGFEKNNASPGGPSLPKLGIQGIHKKTGVASPTGPGQPKLGLPSFFN